MCGRYALVLRPSQIRQMLQDDDMSVADMPDDEGPGAPRQSYNFAPGYHGIVYRADTSDRGAGPRRDQAVRDDEEVDGDNHDLPLQEDTQESTSSEGVKYKLQSMKWGLVPFWTKRNPDYATMMRTINCRDDSLATPGGMWASMKARKRCIVIAQGFFEWLKTSSKEKLPHFVKRKDGRLMCFAGLWDCVQYEDSEDKLYTYTIITTDSNKQLKFLHDRMPVILDPGSENLRTWLDPSRYEWSRDLQSLLRPFDGELEVYPVSKDVGKVGNNSPSFIIPLNSKENKSNIANFFANASKPPKDGQSTRDKSTSLKPGPTVKGESQENIPELRDGNSSPPSTKRSVDHNGEDGPPLKKAVTRKTRSAGGKFSATQNELKSPAKTKTPGTQKITKFFGNNG